MDMDGLTKLLMKADPAALNMVKTLVTTPTLINLDIRQGPIYAIPLMTETNQRNASAEVSESLIIGTEAKQYISDNVAPGSMNWSLGGYIAGVKELEPSNRFQPFVQFNTDTLWSWFEHGALLIYKDGNAQLYDNVVIKSLQTSQQKEAANATPFSMTLKQLNLMEMDLSDLVEDVVDQAKNSIIAAGSKLGKALSLGSTSSTIKTIKNLFKR